MTKTAGTLLLIALTAALPARADDAADRATAARRVLAIAFPPEMYQRVIDKTSAQLPPETRADVIKIMPAYQEMADFELGLFVKYFTAQELGELARFYESPVGAKSLKALPEITADAQSFMMARLQSELPKLMEKWKKAKAAAGAPKP